MRWAAAILAVLGGSDAAATACDRARVPASVEVAQAEAIVVGRIRHAPDSFGRRTIEVDVERVLKGPLRPGRRPLHVPELWDACHGGPLRVSSPHVFFLTNGDVIRLDGTTPLEAARIREIESLVAATPGWSPSREGMQVLAVPAAYEVKTGDDIDVWVLFRNASAAPLMLRYREWPPDRHTYWRLEIADENDVAIPWRPHPHLKKGEIEDFFSRHGHTFEQALAPDEVFPLYIDRINSAKAGWGYKQRLGFGYYPIERPGRYRVSLSSQGDAEAHAAPPFVVTVR